MSESPPDIMLDESYLNELSAEDGVNTESVNWKINNTNLAKENARLRKEIQKYVTIFKENTIRCTNLEVAWRRRGDTLAKVDIISRLAGTQILKLLETLTELRTTCQVDLQTPLEGVAGQLSHLRHSMPSKSGIPINSKSQLVHHVNPMVSGHPIIKPTITLRRLNLNTSTRPQEEEVLEPVEEVDLSSSVGQSLESDEEDVVEVSPDSTRIPTTSPNLSYQNIILPVAEVPLVRLSLSHISERIGSACSPLNGVQDQNRKIYNRRSDMHSGIDCVQSDNQVIEIDSTPLNSSPPSDRSLATNSLRKYPGSRSRLSEDRKSDLTAEVEKCRLVVSLKDVGSYLHNGILSSIEQLEEGKVKTGASAQPESKDSPSCTNSESQLNETVTASQDLTEMNFSGVGVLNYSAVPVRNDNVEGSSSSATKEFLSKLQEEDPLEGPSWRYAGVTTPSKRKRHRTQHSSLSSAKEKNQSASSTSTSKKQIPASLKSPSKLSRVKHEEVQCEERGTNLTNCMALSVKTDALAPPSDCKDKEQTDHSASSSEEPPVLEVAEEKSSITKYNKNKKGKASGVKVKDENCNRKPPSLKKQTDEVAPISDGKNTDKTDNSTSSDAFRGFPTSNVSEENPSIKIKKRRKLLSLDSDEDQDQDEDYIPPSQKIKNSKRSTTVRKPKGKSVKSSISRKKNNNTNVVQRKQGSLQAATEVKTDVETNTENSPNNVSKRRSTSTILIKPTFDRILRRQSPKIQN